MIKNLILAINNNKLLTLTAIALGVITGIFGSATGWFAGAAGILAGASVLILENLRRAFNDTSSHQFFKRWGLLIGIVVCFAVIITAGMSLILSADSLGWIAGIMTAGLSTIATALILFNKAWEDYRPIFRNGSWAVWCLFFGVIILMATSCYALLLMAFGAEVSNLLNSSVILYGGCIGGGLIALFLIVLALFVLGDTWEKIVNWARR